MPRSLFGRLLFLLCIGLLVSQSIALTLLLRDRGASLYHVLVADSSERIAATVELLDDFDAGDRERLANALDLPPLRLRLDLPWTDLPADQSSQAVALRRLLHQQLGAARPVYVSLYRPQDGGLRPQPPSFFIQVGLNDGGIASFLHELPPLLAARPVSLLLSLGAAMSVVLMVSLLAVRGLTQPLAQLAKAARELGDNLDRPPLTERGALEVREATRAFNEMQARLRRQREDRDHLLAAVAHDLKTPIARMRLRAELLDDAGTREHLGVDLAELEATVADTLDLLRAGRGEAFSPLDVSALVEAICEDTIEAGETVSFDGTPSAPLTVRPRALRRCLQNLIDNALRYAKTVEVRLDDSPQQLMIRVLDRGPGLPADVLEAVFEPFRRVEHSRSRATGGSGLGLSIARAIARAHGGDVTLRNREGGGLEARLILPRTASN